MRNMEHMGYLLVACTEFLSMDSKLTSQMPKQKYEKTKPATQ